jgi:hypothetical protein
MKENSIISQFRLWLDHKIFMVCQKLFGPRIKGENTENTKVKLLFNKKNRRII